MFSKKVMSVLVVPGFIVVFASFCLAGGIGTTGAQFLKIGIGARPVSMGYAFSAVSDDLNALYWNPAGLAMQKERQISASYLHYFQEVSIGFFGYSQSIMNRGTVGIGLSYLSVGGFEKRALDTDVPDGKFGANDGALYLSYADEKILGDKIEGLNLGFTIKGIRQEIDDQDATSFALDVGTLYRTPIEKLNASLGVYNIGTKVKFVEESDPLPLDIRFGLSYKMLQEKLLLAADIDDYINDERVYSQLGVEYAMVQSLSFRAGYKFGMDSNKLGGGAGLGTGVGFYVWGIQLDYAYAPFGELGDTHRMSIATKF
ncbi:MAG: PorV/PorQ family protein [bacterium]